MARRPYAFFGTSLTLSPLTLGLKLLAILTGSLLVAAFIRRAAGIAAIRRHAAAIDGINILILLVFVAAVMGNVAGSVWADPVRITLFAALAFAVFFALLGATGAVFRPQPVPDLPVAAVAQADRQRTACADGRFGHRHRRRCGMSRDHGRRGGRDQRPTRA